MDCDFNASALLTFEQALDQLLAMAHPVGETETVSVYQIDGRVLARDITSAFDVPPYDNSAMDGYAINYTEAGLFSAFTVIDTSLAGHPASKSLQPGQAIRIMTGAKIPAGTTAVVMQENVQRNDNEITLMSVPKKNDNIRYRGEDIQQGQIILKQGKLLNPRDSALLAACGLSEIPVFRKVKVTLFSTGDELANPGEPLNPGQIYDSNSPLLLNMLTAMNVSVRNAGLLADDPDAIRAALIQASQESDIIITSGGVSVGDADYIKQILSELGKVNFWKVAMKPGKPLAFGFIDGCAFIGLPGNPVSAAVTFDQLAKPYIKATQNHPTPKPGRLKAIAQNDFNKKPGRMDFQRGIATCSEDGHWEVISAGKQGSAILSALSLANCHVILPAESNGAKKGDSVTISLY